MFKKEKEKNKVGRPKLADDNTKKKALVSVIIAFILIIIILLIGTFKLNIINFNKLKGASSILCNEIPEKYRPRSDSNPNGLHEYGFTDINFYSGVISSLYSVPEQGDTKNYCANVTEEQLGSIESLSATGNQIADSNGIQYLSGVKKISLENQSLTSIDLSKNTLVTDINLSQNKLTSIDLSKNAELTSLDLSDNDNLTSLDLSNNHKVNKLYIFRVPNLTSLDLSNNGVMPELNLGSQTNNSTLTNLNISGMTNLKKLAVFKTKLENTLDLSSSKDLYYIDLEDDNLSSLDLTQNPNLTEIRLSMRNLKQIDLSKNTKLKTLALTGNILFSDPINNPELEFLYLSENNNYIDMNLSSYNKLEHLSLTDSKVGNINFSGSDLFTSLYVDGSNTIKNLNLSNVQNLKELTLGNTLVDNIDLSGNKSLTMFGIDSEAVVGEINLSNTSINLIDFHVKSLDKLNLNNISNITSVNVDESNLSSIDLRGCNNLTRLSLSYNNLTELDLSDNYNLIVLDLAHNKLTDVDISNLKSLNFLNLNDNKLSNIIDLSGFNNLDDIYLAKNKLTNVVLPNTVKDLQLGFNKLSGTIDLSKYQNLNTVTLENNNIENVIFADDSKISYLTLHNNNIKEFDLSFVKEDIEFTLQNNPITSTIYMLKGDNKKYNNNIKLNDELQVKYDIDDNKVISYDHGILTALNEGVSNIKMSTDKITGLNNVVLDKYMYCDTEKCDDELGAVPDEEYYAPYFASNEVKVYDIKSDTYKVDKEKHTLDVGGTIFDKDKVDLTLDGLSSVVDGDNFIIKDGNSIVATYKILNQSKNNGKNDKNSEYNSNVKDSVDSDAKKGSTKTSTTQKLGDIEINGTFVSSLTLEEVKGTDRDIIVKADGITFTINGKDITGVKGNLDLSYVIEELKKSILYNDVKDKFSNGVVLSFKNNYPLLKRILLSIQIDDIIKNNVDTKNILLYKYSKDKLTLIGQNINAKDNKIEFYINDLSNYILSNEKLEDENIKTDSTLIEKNNNLNRGINFKWILWLLLILIILGTIGYIIYKKNKTKE